MNKTLKKKDLKPIETSSPLIEVAKKKGWLTRLPIIKQKYRKKMYPRGFDVEAGQYIPLNLQVGDYESQVIPLKLIDYFIDKAGTIVIRSGGDQHDTGRRKIGAVMGDRTETGCNSVTSPGTLMGPRSLVYPALAVPGGYYPGRTIFAPGRDSVKIHGRGK